MKWTGGREKVERERERERKREGGSYRRKSHLELEKKRTKKREGTFRSEHHRQQEITRKGE